MDRSRRTAMIAALTLAGLAAGAAAQHVVHVDRSKATTSGSRGSAGQHVRHVDLTKSGPAPRRVAPPPTPSRGGLMGVPARLPNVLGRDRSLPLERRITLPGLYPDDPGPQPFPVPGAVGRPDWHGWHDGCEVDGGLTIDGKYSDDHWKLRFHLGSPTIDRCDPPYYHRYWPYYPWYYSYGSYLNTYPIDGYYTQTADYSLLYPQLTQPQPQPQEPAPELTSLQRAQLFMQADALDAAIEAYRDHLENDPEDVESMRALGLAMLEDNRFEDGVAMIALAYRTDPLLARVPLNLASLGIDGRRYDNLHSRVLNFAARTDSASAHLARSVLLQAEGEVRGAIRVLQRAEKAGLAAEILDALRRELGMPIRG